MYLFIHEQIQPFASSIGSRYSTKSFETKAVHAETREERAMTPSSWLTKGFTETQEGLRVEGCLGDKAEKVCWGGKVVGVGCCAEDLDILVDGEEMLETLEEEVM